ncbi:MAG: hypothetical protein ACPH77_11165, partial [Pseudomonadales bacterium]
MLKSVSYLWIVLLLIGCGRNPAENSGEVAVVSNNLPILSVTQDPFFLSGDTQVAAVIAFSDAEGDTVSLSIVGDDAAQFSVADNGELTFLSPPRFSQPSDIDRNSVYRVDVAAFDGTGTTEIAVSIQVVDAIYGIVGTPPLVGAEVTYDQNFTGVKAGSGFSMVTPSSGKFRFRRLMVSENQQQVAYSFMGSPTDAARPIQYALVSRVPADPVIEAIRITPISTMLYSLRDPARK